MPDEIVVLVVRDELGALKDLAEDLSEVSPGLWALRVHDPKTLPIFEAIRDRLPASGSPQLVALDAASLTALETVNAFVSGEVALNAATLLALETINAVVSGSVAVSNFPAGMATEAKLEAVRLLLAGASTAAKQNPLDRYRIADIVKATVGYLGFTTSTGVWYILREDKTVATAPTYRYANLSNNGTINGGAATGYGSSPTTNEPWTNRATLTYAYLHDLTGL